MLVLSKVKCSQRLTIMGLLPNNISLNFHCCQIRVIIPKSCFLKGKCHICICNICNIYIQFTIYIIYKNKELRLKLVIVVVRLFSLFSSADYLSLFFRANRISFCKYSIGPLSTPWNLRTASLYHTSITSLKCQLLLSPPSSDHLQTV